MSVFDVTALGELLIDFTPSGVSQAGNVLFERNPGGAPANVLAAVTSLGGTGAFIGKVGNDQFGHYLKQVLADKNIETKGLKFSEDENTTLAFVHLDEKGDRSFSFYRNPGADTRLEENDLEYGLIDDSKIFHFGSLSMTDEPSKNATLKAVQYAKKKEKIVSYDPNWRPALWKNNTLAKEGIISGLEYADILKISEIELDFITGESDLDQGSLSLFNQGIKLVVITLGPKGCYYRCKAGTGYLPTYNTKVVDTTGAGDSFLGGLLHMISKSGINIFNTDKSAVEEILDFCNAVGSVCASKRGGIPAMPSLSDVRECMAKVPKLL